MEHGLTGYVKHKCRCDICKAAKKSSAAKSNLKNRDHIRAKNAAYGRANREATKVRVAKWVAADPGRARRAGRERTKRYADANRDVVRQRYRDWLAANPDKAKAASAAYSHAHPEKMRENTQQRRVRVLGSDVRVVTGRDWRRLCNRYGGRCAYCGAAGPLHQDHVIPIVRGGRHSIGNLLPACKPCNSSKNDTLLIKWRGRRIGLATKSAGRATSQPSVPSGDSAHSFRSPVIESIGLKAFWSGYAFVPAGQASDPDANSA